VLGAAGLTEPVTALSSDVPVGAYAGRLHLQGLGYTWLTQD
jgi:hypothetical protein